jgi:type II secretory pathway component PulM
MATLPTGRNGRILAAALAVLAVFSVWVALVSPVLDWYGARAARLDDLRARAARERVLIESLPALKKAAEAAVATPTRAVLSGATDAIAGAALQEQVQTMANQASAQLTSIETLPAEQVAGYRRIGVRLELNAQLPVVVALLKSVEEAQPSMLVDDIHLTATPVGMMAKPLPLDASFTVYGFRLGTGKDDQP